MKVYLVQCFCRFIGEPYEDDYDDITVLCIKSTKELAINYIKNLNPTEYYDDEEKHTKWGILSDKWSNDEGIREVHIAEMDNIYDKDGNTVIGHEYPNVNGSISYSKDDLYLTYEVYEYELEES